MTTYFLTYINDEDGYSDYEPYSTCVWDLKGGEMKVVLININPEMQVTIGFVRYVIFE